jgi:large subunit ribosomal protein L31e
VVEEEKEKEEQKTEEEPKESVETVEEAKAEVEQEAEEVSEEVKEEAPEKEEEVVAEEPVEAEREEVPAPVEEEKAKPPREEKAKEEEEIVEERIYTVPLGKCWIAPSNRRAARAMRIIRGFVVKHMKLEKRVEGEEEEEPKRLVISNEVNERVWGRGVGKPPRKIRVRAAKDKEGNVTVYLAEED